ncbi:MAG: thiamine pyrophosphate-dependent dehydrogenase E1 component subunit alpha [Streptosporangiaceae bacterium]
MADDQGLALYQQMVRIQTWEQKLLWLIDEGQISGFYHSGRGQEAIPAGACATLRPDDYIMYAHRGVGYLIAKGLGMDKLFGDFLANTAGTTRGLGAGIVHIAWPELGILGQSGTLGGCFPIAAGAALSAQYRGTDQVCVCFFGEGTSSRGTFHEALNAASLWRLPVIFLCENNGYGATVPAAEMLSNTDVAAKAAGYGMPGQIVDGMDVEAVRDAVADAVERARAGEGPSLIEAKTYRFRGHFEGDPQTYRSRAELEEWRKRDPIVVFSDRLTSGGRATPGDLERIRRSAHTEVEAAAETALAAPMPSDDRIYQYVYA